MRPRSTTESKTTPLLRSKDPTTAKPVWRPNSSAVKQAPVLYTGPLPQHVATMSADTQSQRRSSGGPQARARGATTVTNSRGGSVPKATGYDSSEPRNDPSGSKTAIRMLSTPRSTPTAPASPPNSSPRQPAVPALPSAARPFGREDSGMADGETTPVPLGRMSSNASISRVGDFVTLAEVKFRELRQHMENEEDASRRTLVTTEAMVWGNIMAVEVSDRVSCADAAERRLASMRSWNAAMKRRGTASSPSSAVQTDNESPTNGRRRTLPAAWTPNPGSGDALATEDEGSERLDGTPGVRCRRAPNLIDPSADEEERAREAALEAELERREQERRRRKIEAAIARSGANNGLVTAPPAPTESPHRETASTSDTQSTVPVQQQQQQQERRSSHHQGMDAEVIATARASSISSLGSTGHCDDLSPAPSISQRSVESRSPTAAALASSRRNNEEAGVTDHPVAVAESGHDASAILEAQRLRQQAEAMLAEAARREADAAKRIAEALAAAEARERAAAQREAELAEAAKAAREEAQVARARSEEAQRDVETTKEQLKAVTLSADEALAAAQHREAEAKRRAEEATALIAVREAEIAKREAELREQQSSPPPRPVAVPDDVNALRTLDSSSPSSSETLTQRGNNMVLPEAHEGEGTHTSVMTTSHNPSVTPSGGVQQNRESSTPAGDPHNESQVTIAAASLNSVTNAPHVEPNSDAAKQQPNESLGETQTATVQRSPCLPQPVAVPDDANALSTPDDSSPSSNHIVPPAAKDEGTHMSLLSSETNRRGPKNNRSAGTHASTSATQENNMAAPRAIPVQSGHPDDSPSETHNDTAPGASTSTTPAASTSINPREFAVEEGHEFSTAANEPHRQGDVATLSPPSRGVAGQVEPSSEADKPFKEPVPSTPTTASASAHRNVALAATSREEAQSGSTVEVNTDPHRPLDRNDVMAEEHSVAQSLDAPAPYTTVNTTVVTSSGAEPATATASTPPDASHETRSIAPHDEQRSASSASASTQCQQRCRGASAAEVSTDSQREVFITNDAAPSPSSNPATEQNQAVAREAPRNGASASPEPPLPLSMVASPVRDETAAPSSSTATARGGTDTHIVVTCSPPQPHGSREQVPPPQGHRSPTAAATAHRSDLQPLQAVDDGEVGDATVMYAARGVPFDDAEHLKVVHEPSHLLFSDESGLTPRLSPAAANGDAAASEFEQPRGCCMNNANCLVM